MKALGKTALARSLEVVLGRKHLYRLGRFLFNYARLDLENDMEVNGELYVQRAALSSGINGSTVICFDVGANVGLWSKAMLRQAEADHLAVQVHAFEPCNETFAALKSNLNGNFQSGKFIALKKACSDHVGHATLNIIAAGCCGVNSIVPGKRLSAESTEEVELTTVDAYCAESFISKVRLLKIDAEGHDLSVIKGSAEMLRRQAIDILQFEYNQSWIESRSFLRDAFETLQGFGYKVGKITRRGIEFYGQWSYELETFCEGNYIACTAEWKERFRQIDPGWMSAR